MGIGASTSIARLSGAGGHFVQMICRDAKLNLFGSFLDIYAWPELLEILMEPRNKK